MKKKVRYFRSSKQHTAELLESFWNRYFNGDFEGVDAVLYCGVIHTCNVANMNLPTLDACLTSYAELGRLCGMDWRCVKSGLLTLANNHLIRYQQNGRKVLVGLLPLGKEEKKQRKSFSPETPYPIEKKEKKEKSAREEKENAPAEISALFVEGDLKERRGRFIESVQPFVTKYGPRACEEFIEHWTEPTPDGQRMRFELEKTWSVAVRLSKWKRYELKAIGPKSEERKAADNTAALEREQERVNNEKRRDWDRLCACPPWAVKLLQTRGLSTAVDTETICGFIKSLELSGKLSAEELSLWQQWSSRREKERVLYERKYGKISPP